MLLPALAATLLGSLGACRATPAAEPPARGDVRPTLAEVFLIPGIQGRPPRAQSLSADGRWLLLRWNPMTTDETGARAISDEDSLRLLDVEDPGASDHLGTRLVELLPPPEAAPDREEDEQPPAAKPVTAWSLTGHRLAVALDRGIWLLDHDGTAWRAELAWEPRPEPEAEEGEDEPQQGAEAEVAREPILREPRTLEFRDDDRVLRVASRREAFEFRLDAPRPWSLEAATWLTGGVDPEASWSDDYRVAFGQSRPLRRLGDAEQEEDRTPAQVWHRDGDRYVTLAGYAELEDPSASLSPDGRTVFAEVDDESGQPEPTLVPDYLTTRVSTLEARRQWADDTPAPRTYHVWDTESGADTPLELPEDEGTWLSSMGWAPTRTGVPARLGLHRFSADWRAMEIWVWSEGVLRMVFRDSDERWFGGPASYARWSHDGRTILLGSESTPVSLTPGRSQLFALDVESGALRQLTEVEGEVSSFSPLEDGSVAFVASDANPARRYVGRVPAGAVDGGLSAARTWARRWPGPPGWNDAPVTSRDGSLVVYSHAELGVPSELWAADETESWRLTRTIPPEYQAVDWIRPVKFQARHEDGTRVHSHVYLPPGSSLERPDRRRACVVFIHGAGYLQNVTDSMTEYDVNLMFHSRLARLGYVVVDVDYRGSEGYGNDFRTRLQFHLGGLDLDDIHLVVDALAEQGVIDRERVACYGGSYGGFLTLMALFTAPDRWVGGAALRSVTDWRTYHPGYTQPRLGRPSTNPEAFERSSPIDHVSELEDPVLILHGMVDTNVFAQDSIRLIEALIDQGADFDAMLYPSQGHAFSDGMHWLDEYRRIEEFLIEVLGDA